MSNPLDKLKQLETRGKTRLKNVFKKKTSGAAAPATASAAAPAVPAANPAAAPAANQAANLVGKAVEAANPPKNLKDFTSARNNALNVLVEIRKMPGAADGTGKVAERIKTANTILSDADAAVGKATTEEQVKTQIEALQKIRDEAREARKESDKYVTEHPANLGDFEDKLKEAYDRVAKARTYRGAFIDANTKHPKLQEAEDLLAKAAKAARGAKKFDAAVVTTAIEQIKGIDSKLRDLKAQADSADDALDDKFDAYPKWSKQYAAAKDARDALASDPLAKEEHRKICKLISNGEEALRKDGAVEALRKLGDFTVFVDDAKARRSNLDKAKLSPELEQALKALGTTLDKYTLLAPEQMISAHRDTMEEYRFLGVDGNKSAEAAKKLGDLKTLVEGEMTTLKEARDKAALKQKAIADKMQAMTDAGMDPGLLEFLKKQVQHVIERDFVAREWKRADSEFDGLQKGVEELEKEQGEKSREWQKGAKRRAEMRARAVELAGWPPLAQQAMNLRALLDGLDKEVKASFDYVAVAQEFAAKNPEEILKQLEAAYAKYDARPEALGGKLADLQSALVEARGLYNKAETEASNAVRVVEAQLEGVADVTANHLRVELKKLDKAWREYTLELKVKTPPSDQFKAAPALTAKDMAKPFTDELTRIKEEALKADQNHKSSTHEEFKQKAQGIEKAGGNVELPKVITSLLEQLAGMGVPLAQDRDHFAKLRAETDPAKQASGYQDFRKALQTDLDKRKRENAEKFAAKVGQTKEDLDLGVETPLKKLRGRHKGYEAYQRELEAQAGDLAAMAASGDAFLVEACKEETAKLRNKVKAIDPKQRGAEATRYKEVDEAMKKLGEALGGDIRKYLPTTHRALTAKLVELKEETGRSSPARGLQLLELMQKEVSRAETRAESARKEREKYKQMRDQLDKQWIRVKKLTDMRVTDRATHFADRLSEQMANADAASGTEADEKNKNSGPALAISLLKELTDALDKIEGSGDGSQARVALQEKDAEIEQENRFIADLATDFKLQVKAFRDTVIPSARKILEDQDGDLEMLENLETSVKQATKTVQPYLDMLSSLPKPGKPRAPKRSKAEQDFKTAQSALTAVSRTVLALRNGVGSTNVDVTGDLKKVEANWREKTKKYSQAVTALADEIVATADADNMENAEKAAKVIRGVADDFLPQAFAPEIHILTNKETAKADGKPRLAAREKALKIMRANRKILQEHPVHTQLTAANTAFKGSKVNSAARDLLIALKRLELEVLVGI